MGLASGAMVICLLWRPARRCLFDSLLSTYSLDLGASSYRNSSLWLLQVLALGLYGEEGTYLRDSWNVLDAFIVILSLFDETAGAILDTDLAWIRALRALRPLRMINKAPNLKVREPYFITQHGIIFILRPMMISHTTALLFLSRAFC